MKKICNVIILSFACVFLWGTTSFAEEIYGSSGWTVTFDSKKQMISNFSNKDFADVLTYMQPGDSANIQITIKNTYPDAIDWYMTNEVIQSLEDASTVARDGAYSYLLTYTPETGAMKVLYDSENVGGEKKEDELQGLHEATNALEDYFFLDTLEHGKTGVVKLRVMLEGETQGNDYQDTFARLKIDFAVELPVVFQDEKEVFHFVNKIKEKYITKTDETIYIRDEETPLVVKTGDETDMTFLFIAGGILGLLLLLLSLLGMRLRKEIRES